MASLYWDGPQKSSFPLCWFGVCKCLNCKPGSKREKYFYLWLHNSELQKFQSKLGRGPWIFHDESSVSWWKFLVFILKPSLLKSNIFPISLFHVRKCFLYLLLLVLTIEIQLDHSWYYKAISRFDIKRNSRLLYCFLNYRSVWITFEKSQTFLSMTNMIFQEMRRHWR